MSGTSEPRPFTLARLRADVAEVLYVEADELADDENVFDQGMDSIRTMTLLESWRADGAEVDFTQLAERPTLSAWAALLAPQATAPAATQAGS
ncbi:MULTISPECIES: phosphopantetheine-binding protein [Streptomyces]|uniref:Phosphopantetheine-binding protein n=1 Tax=Streptomyces lichenis TaxID=2306967 RepID=A0ABT0I4E2_9ACTN|nr:phosphopantetheine-binding protein [Streptomyces lichenis]MCK8676152.1 phosphopantetheine-binding protein [Streptomyces lichenis]